MKPTPSKPHIWFKDGLWWREWAGGWITCAKELKTLARIDLPVFRRMKK